MITKDQIIKAIKSKQSNKICAKKLNISLNEYLERKQQVIRDMFSDIEKDSYITALQEKITEYSENVKKVQLQ